MGAETRNGADPDALGALAMVLERTANELDDLHHRLSLLSRAPSLGALRAAVDWLRVQAGDVRRRAVLVLAAGKSWRHPSLWDHLGGLGMAAVHGLRTGAMGLVETPVAALEFDWFAVTDPKRAAGIALHAVENMRTLDPAYPLFLDVAAVKHLRDDGLWAVADDWVYDTTALVPAAALTVAGADARFRGDAATASSYASTVVEPAPASSTHLLPLSVPVGTN